MVEERKEVRGMPYTLVLICCVICMLIGVAITYVRMEKCRRGYESAEQKTIVMELEPDHGDGELDYDGGDSGTAGSGRACDVVLLSGAVIS